MPIRIHAWQTAVLLSIAAAPASVGQGQWRITQLPIANALHPVINNTGEIVWYLNSDGGIFSSVRGKLADAGINPHLANSGEVVYAGWFGGPAWDLVSTTRGRLTHGSIIDVNLSDFDVNAQGEVVYVTTDNQGYPQVHSTVRNQITFDPAVHLNPCIADHGEIVWNQYAPRTMAITVSTTRGVLPDTIPYLLDLNNLGEICFMGNLEGPPGSFSSPHVFTSTHGVVIDDPTQMQWGGSLNDAGTVVWTAPERPGSATWYVYQADWSASDTTPPRILSIRATPNVLWPPNHQMVPITVTVEAVDDTDPSPTIQITQVLSSEPPGRFAPDWAVTGSDRVKLRAERRGTGQGRTYTILIQCRDTSGNVATGSVEVSVPHGRD